jgi:hypothetical protein
MSRPLSLPTPLHQEVGDITVSPTRNCLSSSNYKHVSRTTYSFSHVAFPMGKSFHLIRYSLMLLIWRFFSQTYSISSGIRTSCPSSSRGGITSRGMMCWPMALFRQDTWKTLCILLPRGSSSSQAMAPTFLLIL